MIFLLKKNLKRLYAQARSLKNQNKIICTDARILLYHSIGGSPGDHRLAIRVSEEKFREEMTLLVDLGYKTVTVSQLLENAVNSNLNKCIAITFDDGYKDNILTAAPIMKRLGIKATFFITSSYIDGLVRKQWDDGLPREYLSWEDISALSSMGFEIGSHSVHHINLTSLNDEELREELECSRKIIAKRIKKEIKVISYPYGKFDLRTISMVKAVGYNGACSSVFGVVRSGTNYYALRRSEIDGYDTSEDFKHKLCGWYD